MRQFLAQFRLTGRQWLALACVAGLVATIVVLAMQYQAVQYAHSVDVVTLRGFRRMDAAQEKMRQAIKDLQLANEKAIREHEKIKETVAPLKGIPKEIEELKDAAKRDEGKP